MANGDWHLTGPYIETCSCAYLCPCITGVPRPTKGHCLFAALYHIERGRYGDVVLDGLSVVLARTPEAMDRGNWSVGLIVDRRANPEQHRVLATLFGGQAGGPMAAVAALTGTFLGVETRPIHFHLEGMDGWFSVPDLADHAVEGVGPGPPRYLDAPGHPGGPRLALAKAARSHVHAFGLDWDDETGENNGHFSTFHWQAG